MLNTVEHHHRTCDRQPTDYLLYRYLLVCKYHALLFYLYGGRVAFESINSGPVEINFVSIIANNVKIWYNRSMKCIGCNREGKERKAQYPPTGTELDILWSGIMCDYCYLDWLDSLIARMESV